MRQTSVLAYFEEKIILNNREKIVYEMFKVQGNMTAKECQFLFGFKDGNMVKPRITDLCRKGLLESKGKRIDSISPFKLVHVWGVVR